MARMQVIIDGEERFDGDVPDAFLPEQPHQFPRALGAPGTIAPGQQPPPLAKLFMLTAFIEVIVKTLEAPMLGPLKVQVQTRGPGCFTLMADSPNMPSMDDIAP